MLRLMPDIDEPVALCVLLWAHPGRTAELVAYEDEVLKLLVRHGAALLSRVRGVEASGVDSSGDGDAPTEVHVIRFAARAGFDTYMADPDRLAMAERRDAAIARTEVHRVTVVPSATG